MPGGAMLLLLLLLLPACYSFSNSPFRPRFVCPEECECDFLPPHNSSLSVYCHQGGLNDTRFADILNRLPASELRTLDVSAPVWRQENKIKWNDNLNRFSQLKTLRLVRCGLPSMSRSFRSPHLELLDLSHNRIEHASMGMFAALPQLRHMILSHNRLSILPTGVFNYLKNLRSLSLADNSITELSTNLLRGLHSLRSLHLSHNRIPAAQIDELFADVPQLTELYLEHCHLRSLQNLTLSKVSGLETLSVSGNDLTSIPSDDLSPLVHLSHLDLSHNHISNIHACAFCGMNVSRLNMAHNMLGLAKEPFHPDAFSSTTLLDLDVGYCHLNEFDSLWLGHAQASLTTLSLSGNFLRGFPGSATHSLPRLTRLHLAFNSIDRIPALLPFEYRQLLSLNLSGNFLSRLADHVPSALPALHELDLSENRLHTLSQREVDYLDSLERVFLHSNPWDCSCSVARIQLHMRARYALRHTMRYDEARCNEPALVKGQPLLAVSAVNDCAVLFGARYGLSQSSELFILLAGLLAAALVLCLFLCLCYYTRERQYKGSYVTRETSRTPLTMTLPGSHCGSSNQSTVSEPLDDHLPPPPPKAVAAYYNI